MFAVIYRSYTKPGFEQEYQESWHQVATYFKEYRGALGSCLHRAADGMWLAYSRWPSKEMRDASWPGVEAPSEDLPAEIRSAILKLQQCLDLKAKQPEICLEVVDDLLFL